MHTWNPCPPLAALCIFPSTSLSSRFELISKKLGKAFHPWPARQNCPAGPKVQCGAAWGRSVMFNFLGRDFFTALSNKDQAKFTEMLFKWLAALCVGIPVFVFRDYYQARPALLSWARLVCRATGQARDGGETSEAYNGGPNPSGPVTCLLEAHVVDGGSSSAGASGSEPVRSLGFRVGAANRANWPWSGGSG